MSGDRAVVRRLVVPLVFFLSMSASARAEASDDAIPARLSLDEALRLLRTRGLDLLIADAAIDAAAADVDTAGAVINPQVSVGIGRSFTYDPSLCAGCSQTSWSAGLSDQGALADSLFGRRRLRVTVARSTLTAVRAGRTDALRQLSFEVRQQYVAAASAQAQADLAEEGRGLWQQVLEVTRARLREGAISEADVAKAETAALSAAQEVSAASQGLAVARSELAFFLGVRGGTPEFTVDQAILEVAPRTNLLAASPSSLLDLARDTRPDLRVAVAEVATAERALAVARRQRAPGIAFSLQGAGQGTGQNALLPPTLSVGIAVTPPLFYQYQGEISRAEAVLREQRLTLAKVEAQVARDVGVARANYAATTERNVRMRTALLGSAERARNIAKIQYEKGAASFLELLDAQRTYLDIKRDAVRDAADHAVALFQVEQALGEEPPL